MWFASSKEIMNNHLFTFSNLLDPNKWDNLSSNLHFLAYGHLTIEHSYWVITYSIDLLMAM